MKTPFGKDLYQLDSEFLTEAYELDETGWITLDRGEKVRVKLTSDEKADYIAALSAYDQFLGLLRINDDPDLSLSKLSNKNIRDRVRAYNDWAAESGVEDQRYCFAAFMGDHLEDLLCGGSEERYEPVESDEDEV
jgi:hypothetical protein